MADLRLRPTDQPSATFLKAYRLVFGIGQFFSQVRERVKLRQQQKQERRRAAAAERFARMTHEEKREALIREMGHYDPHLLNDVLPSDRIR